MDVTIDVPAKLEWVAAPLTVKKGDVVSLSASGTWVDFYVPCTPDGYAAPLFYWLGRPPRIPDGNRYFRLMGRIGDPDHAPDSDDPKSTFVIGLQAQVTAGRDGRLYVFANDKLGQYWNNWGEVRLRIHTSPSPVSANP